MLRRPSERRHRLQSEKELNITAFLNLMVVLIPYLLATAVFTRLVVLQMSLPTPSASAGPTPQVKRLELVVRILPESIEVMGGGKKLAAIPRTGRDADAAALAGILKDLKRQFPQDSASTVLSRPEIPYQALIQVMDVLRDAGFPEISIGESRAP
jgi:biopolymer transport protein ExbD